MYFFDTYALIEMALVNPSYSKYEDFTLVTMPLNIGEFYSYLIRTYGKKTAREKLKLLSFRFVGLTRQLIEESTEFKTENNEKKLSWADCIGYVASKQLKLKFLTGDKEFKGMDNVEFVR